MRRSSPRVFPPPSKSSERCFFNFTLKNKNRASAGIVTQSRDDQGMETVEGLAHMYAAYAAAWLCVLNDEDYVQAVIAATWWTG